MTIKQLIEKGEWIEYFLINGTNEQLPVNKENHDKWIEGKETKNWSLVSEKKHNMNQVMNIEQLKEEFTKRIKALPNHYYPKIAVRTKESVYCGDLRNVSVATQLIHLYLSQGEEVTLGMENITALELLDEEVREVS